MSVDRPEPDVSSAIFRQCDSCGATDAVYLPPWARRSDLVWDVDVDRGNDESLLHAGIAYCAFCKARVRYGVPQPPS